MVSPFSVATAYLIRMPNEKPGEPGSSTAYFLGNESISFAGEFVGKPNNGPISLTGLTADKYYAIGNPYPSTINADEFLNANTTGGALYFWRKRNASTGSAYATYTLAGGTAPVSGGNGIGVPNGTIQIGQGFIVKTGITSNLLNFSNNMRTTNNSNQIFRTKKTDTKSRIWLALSKSTDQLNQILIAYLDGATVGVDHNIDGKYIDDSKTALTSIINDEFYSVQGRPKFDSSDVVDLNFKSEKAGNYTIALDSYDGTFSTEQDVYLIDKFLGKETNIKNSVYNFTAAANENSSRFLIKYQKTLKSPQSTIDENNVSVYKRKGVLHINSGRLLMKQLTVFDISGKVIISKEDVNNNKIEARNNIEENQVLIVKIILENNVLVTKKILH